MVIFSPNPDQIKNILILGHANIGDVCGDLSVIKPLRAHFTNAKIYYLTSPKTKSLVEGYKGIEEVIVIDTKNAQKTWGARYMFNKGLWKYKFDLIIVLTRTLMHNFLYTRYVWNVRKKYKGDFISKKVHPIDIYKSFFNSKNVLISNIEYDFDLSQEDQFAGDFLQKHGVGQGEHLVGILPMAAWPIKNWPVEYWNALSQKLWDGYRIKTVALGKSGRGKYSQHVMKNISPEIVSAIDQTSLKQALALIKRCDVFIGPDSSLLHWASCLGIETIGLYGPTPVDYVYPYFHRDNIILAQKQEGMACQGDATQCPCALTMSPSPCMQSLTVEKVSEAVVSCIKNVQKI